MSCRDVLAGHNGKEVTNTTFTRQLKIQNALVLTFMAVVITRCEERGEGIDESRLQTQPDCFGLVFESSRLILYICIVFARLTSFWLQSQIEQFFQQLNSNKLDYFLIIFLAGG